MRACFKQFSCLHPNGEQWSQATLSTDLGGLGLRSLAQHCHAAFLASRSSCYDLCRQLDSNHTFESGGDAPEYQAFRAYNNCVNDDKRLAASSLGKLRQKELSLAVDERTFGQLTAQEMINQSQRAHLKLVSASGASLWPNAATPRPLG